MIVTDGLENASREHTRDSVFKMVENRRTQGWVFVFLGAYQDAYTEGTAMGVAAPNAAQWDKTPKGTRKMWRDLEYSTTAHRQKARAARRTDADAFYTQNPQDD